MRAAALRRKRGRLVVLLAAWWLTSGCASIFLAGGPSLDVGSVEIHDRRANVGQHLAVGFQDGADGSGLGGALHLGLVGYPDSGDGDPILQTVADVGYRHLWGHASNSIRPFHAFGAGAGVFSVLAGAVDPNGAVVHAYAELGAQYTGRRLILYLAARERPALWVGSGAVFLNSLQVSVGVGYRMGGREAGGVDARRR